MNMEVARNGFVALLGLAMIYMAIRLAFSKDSGNYSKSTAHGYTGIVVLVLGGLGASLTAASVVGWTKFLAFFGIGA